MDKIRWQVIFIMCVIAITFKRFKSLVNRRLLLNCVIWFRVYIVIDFIFSCFTLIKKYNKPDLYLCCFYLVFLVITFFLISKFIKMLKKGGKNDN
jgi:hypothetical protein